MVSDPERRTHSARKAVIDAGTVMTRGQAAAVSELICPVCRGELASLNRYWAYCDPCRTLWAKRGRGPG